MQILYPISRATPGDSKSPLPFSLSEFIHVVHVKFASCFVISIWILRFSKNSGKKIRTAWETYQVKPFKKKTCFYFWDRENAQRSRNICHETDALSYKSIPSAHSNIPKFLPFPKPFPTMKWFFLYLSHWNNDGKIQIMWCQVLLSCEMLTISIFTKVIITGLKIAKMCVFTFFTVLACMCKGSLQTSRGRSASIEANDSSSSPWLSGLSLSNHCVQKYPIKHFHYSLTLLSYIMYFR